jgi:hypothetical protein
MSLERGAHPEADNLQLRRETIVPLLALLVIAAALSLALVDTIETGRERPPSDRTD